MLRVPWISCLLLLTFSACGGNDPVDKQANKTGALPDISATGPTSAGDPHVRTTPAEAAPARTPAASIPEALQGRWGMTPGDCTSALGDAKGLLVINASELRFYESRAVPAGDVEGDANSMNGNFVFTGEGQTWVKYEALKVDKGVLTRTETKPTASFSYAKCG